MEKYFKIILSAVLYSLIFLFPFFFLNLTQEYFITNKIYLLGFGSLLLVLISTIQILVSKKISWQNNSFDNTLILFIMSIAISTLFSSTNKIQALINPNFGLVVMIFFMILYFYISRGILKNDRRENILLHITSVLLSLTTIVYFFQPFKNINLPQNLAFLKNPAFTPVGSQLDLAILLGFFAVLSIGQLLNTEQYESDMVKKKVSKFMILTFNLVALFVTVYSLLKQPLTAILPPFRFSWFAALEVLKNPQTAIIGIGPDNFSAIFTRVKDFSYSQSSLWQINSFNVSHSAILQILTEAGIFGLSTFAFLVFYVFRLTVKQLDNKIVRPLFFTFVYLLICLFVFPPTLTVWFLFFIILGLINQSSTVASTIDLKDLLPIYIGTVVVSFALIGTSGYFLGRTYLSEYYFKKSLDGIVNNSIKQVYDNQRQAIILNPYIERFRSQFSKTNLLIADNLAKKGPKKITEQDRQTVTQAIQAAIAEAKAVVTLNPQKADNWQNLAVIYLNIINAAQGADIWTISAYQRAILADPQNPTYRVGLGGVYYSLQKFDDAVKFFEQAITLKPDWPNANYNYAWANFRIKNYPQAVNAMQNTLALINAKTNKDDYEKIKKELEDFKKMLPSEEASTDSSNLNLPKTPTTQIDPKLELPKESSPEAK